jgi:hypothetical protein
MLSPLRHNDCTSHAKGRRRYAVEQGTDMIDSMTQFISGQTLPFCVLLGGCIIVVVEAVRASRIALWGDMFAEDLEE